jgi:hypothetical protein
LVYFAVEVDKKKQTYSLTGKMHVEIFPNVSENELKEIENVLTQTIANSLGCNPEQIKVKVDPETGEATYVIYTNDSTLADEIQIILKTKDFQENVNRGISENSETLPEIISKVLAINEVNVNSLFWKNKINNFRTFSFHFLKI